MKRRKQVPLSADAPLSTYLTERFISDLSAALSADTTVRARYLEKMLLTKYSDPSPESAKLRRTAAIEKWQSIEVGNRVTNSRLNRWANSDSVDILPGVSARKFFERVRFVVNAVLPHTPSLDFAYGGFSGGASTSKGKRHSHPAVKFLDKADVTRSAYPLFQRMIAGTRWSDHLVDSGLDPRFVVGNVMFTVPKNSDIDRCACKEPDLNMFLQKAFGNQIRYCLKRVGIDLNDQKRNQDLARYGAVTGRLATLDLSSASDSVTCALVRESLPPDWHYYLDLVRSPATEVDGSVVYTEMFSSMGNGFTFELESLLFYAITRATTYFMGVRGTVSVYGDDIIAPTEVFDALCSALAFCGFKPNADKSFAEGPFRESCGAHWHGDQDISPFYIRGPFKVVSDLILTLNQLTRWASDLGGIVDPRYEVLLRRYWEYVPETLWGGCDTTSRTSLVTGHSPRGELVYPVTDRKPYHIGGLLLWLFTALNRDREGCLFVSRVSTPSFALSLIHI